MANTALSFGIALIALGVITWAATGMESPTALIPAAVGLLLALAGFMARDPVRRKTWMHIAVGIALLGFLGAARGLTRIGAVLAGEPVERANAVIAQSVMAVLCLIFIALAVNSFIKARRQREPGRPV